MMGSTLQIINDPMVDMASGRVKMLGSKSRFSKVVTCEKIAVIATVVKHVGKYANRLDRPREGGKEVRAGNKYLCTTRRSKI